MTARRQHGAHLVHHLLHGAPRVDLPDEHLCWMLFNVRPSSIRACEMRLIIDEKDVQEPSGPMSDPPAEAEALLGVAVLVDCSAARASSGHGIPCLDDRNSVMCSGSPPSASVDAACSTHLDSRVPHDRKHFSALDRSELHRSVGPEWAWNFAMA